MIAVTGGSGGIDCEPSRAAYNAGQKPLIADRGERR